MSSQLPILQKISIFRLVFFLFFLLSLFFLNTDNASARTRCGVAAGSCGPAQCAVNVYEGSVLYSDQDNCDVQPYTIIVEYFQDSACTQSTSNPCPASCTSSSECNGGVCANTSLATEDICEGVVPSGNKWCMGALCGYERGSCNGTTYNCTQLLPPNGVGYPDLASCQASCSLPTPTPLPAPILSGPPQSNCSADGRTLTYSWNAITGAVRYAIRINDWANGWNDTNPLAGDTIDNNVNGTSYSRSSTPGATYDAWVHAVDSRDVYSPASNHVLLTCPAAPTATLPPGVTPTATPIPTAGPTPTPTGIPCVRCGAGGAGYCSGSLPIAFPQTCQPPPNCTATWIYQGDAQSARCNATYPDLYPYCWECSVPLPTATPNPLATPTPTPEACLWNAGNASCDQQGEIGRCNYRGCTQAQQTCQALCQYDNASGDPQQCTVRNQAEVTDCFDNSPCDRDPNAAANGGTNQRINSIGWSSPAGSCPVAPAASTLTGTVFVDENNNGVKQGTERGWSNVRIYLSGGALSGMQSTTSDTNGDYRFTGLTTGTNYRLEIEVPFGFSPAASFSLTTFPIPPAPIRTDLPLVPYQVAGGVYTTTDSSCPPSPSSKTPVRGHSPIDLTETYFSIDYPSGTDVMGTDGDGLYNFSPAYSPSSLLAPSDSYSITAPAVASSVFSCLTVANTDDTTTNLTTPLPYEFFELSPTEYKKTINFYYLIAVPWFRGVGADMRIDSGFNDPLPPLRESGSNSNRYALLNGAGGTPGVIFSGNNLYDFCLEDGDCKNTRSSERKWVVGGISFPEVFTPAITGTTRTSYRYLLGLAKQNGQTPVEISDPDCYAPDRGCNLATDRDPGVVYTNAAGEPDVYMRQSTFNDGGFVFLINGNLHILGNINVSSSPATTLTVSVSGDITVDKDVGGGSGTNATHIEGFYSADGSFIIESKAGTNPIGSNCPSNNRDNRLNMAGSVVVNADLKGGGTLDRKRSLCGDSNGNVNYPAFQIEERPDFILNALDFLKHPSFVWQEVAP